MTERADRLVFAPPPTILVPVSGNDRLYPVRRIYCVGRNYGAHIREMGGDEREPPFFFQKPTDSIVPHGGTAPYPPGTQDFQYEVELVLAVGKPGRNISVEAAAAHVFGVAVGIDLTRRDLQLKARNSGRPWEDGKSFDASAPLGDILPLGAAGLPANGRIELLVNDALRQEGDLSEMIWSAVEIVSQLSARYALAPGDLIYTGTPSGVGPISPGDEILGRVQGVGEVRVHIGEPLG